MTQSAEMERMIGTLDHRQDGGPSGCVRCGWRGVASYIRKNRSNVCPVYGTAEERRDDPMDQQRQVEKVGRNQPCPRGSNLKFKKCCGA